MIGLVIFGSLWVFGLLCVAVYAWLCRRHERAQLHRAVAALAAEAAAEARLRHAAHTREQAPVTDADLPADCLDIWNRNREEEQR